MLQVAQFHARHMFRSAVRHSHQAFVLAAVHSLQSNVSGFRNTGDESRRERHRIHAVPFGLEQVGQGKPRTVVHDAPVDVRRHHQTTALPDTNGRNDILGELLL